MPPKVLNAADAGKYPPLSVYIGRPSKWGNPFRIGKNMSREDVVDKYYDYILKNEKLLADINELQDKDLVCWCAPLPCHGDILLMLANTE